MFAVLVLLVVAGTSIWVAIDASNLGAKRGVLGGGFFDSSAVAWFFGCLLMWIIVFPAYLVTRPRLVAAKATRQPGPGGYAPAYGYPPAGAYSPAPGYPMPTPVTWPPQAPAPAAAPAHNGPRFCSSCGAALMGAFCSVCGTAATSQTGR